MTLQGACVRIRVEPWKILTNDLVFKRYENLDFQNE